MTDKEQLEKIRQIFLGQVYNINHAVTFDRTHAEWLIKQSEEAQELRGKVEHYEMKYENSGAIFNKQHMRSQIEKLEEENLELNRCVEQERQKVKEYETQERYLLARLEKAEGQHEPGAVK